MQDFVASHQTASPQTAITAAPMPKVLKLVLGSVLGLLVIGAALLLTGRGEALLIDLYASAGQWLCF
jgi:hypothetical protein